MEPEPGQIHHQTFTLHNDGKLYWSISQYDGPEDGIILAESIFIRIVPQSAQRILSAIEECISRPKRIPNINDTGWALVAEYKDGKKSREKGSDPFDDVRRCRDLSEYIRKILNQYYNVPAVCLYTKDFWLFEVTPFPKTGDMNRFIAPHLR